MNKTIKSPPLLPRHFKVIGFLCIATGLLPGYLYYFGGKPAFFEVPVFAVITTYFQTRFLVIARTNILDEAAILLMLTGLIFIGFSRDKNESELKSSFRVRALFHSVYLTAAFWALMLLTIFGWSSILASAFVFALFLIFNIILFRIYLLSYNLSQSKSNQIQKDEDQIIL